jgi:hypothetical protein
MWKRAERLATQGKDLGEEIGLCWANGLKTTIWSLCL